MIYTTDFANRVKLNTAMRSDKNRNLISRRNCFGAIQEQSETYLLPFEVAQTLLLAGW